MSQGIRRPAADVSKVRECLLCRLGALSGREMGADSRTQSPGELCQIRLQDTRTLSLSKSYHCKLFTLDEATPTFTLRNVLSQMFSDTT